MPNDWNSQANSCSRNYESGAHAIGVDQVGLMLADAGAHSTNRRTKGCEIANQRVHSPSEARVQLVHVGARDVQGLRFFLQLSSGRTHQDGFKTAAIQSRKNKQQHALGAADLAGVVVKKNLQFASRARPSSALIQPMISQPIGATA